MATGLEAPLGAFRVVGAMRTDVGRVRSSNEDSVAFVAPAPDAPEAKSGYLAIVADGMGGHAAGEVASALATEVVRRVFYSLDVEPPRALKAAFDAANRAVFEQSAREPECKGMGTTCTAVVIRDGRLWLAHVGDSRAYIVRGREVSQLSDDQTLHAQLVREGVMTQEEVERSPGGNVILQAVGTRKEVAPTIWSEGLPLAIGDAIVLCSDGLSNLVSDVELAAIVPERAPQESCRLLVDAALAAGGHDNISVGVFRIVAPPGARSDQAATQKISVVADGAPPTRVVIVR
ncbi:serine/threonine-protein phosphatase [Methylosinus sp. H3A]|uniref:PP2C family protein-serine/threonine phosphatase n=1 Tax=Methylosinus sp. H3A TaxID=2785786 RepID=UPI0018C2DB0C|nr:PP2C family serine/threonine-protein phosphatase [Methylosinus sp. H3A]MBG0811494.1 serine/threonine-protein phosphatase [Methylosinus sp. H3A]